MKRSVLRTARVVCLAVLLCGVVIAAKAAEENVEKAKPEKAEPKREQAEKFTGAIGAIDLKARTVTVKMVLASKTFQVAPDCRIVTKDKPKATLKALKVGDEVDVTYQEQNGVLVAHVIEHKGIGKEREEAKEKEQLEKILTPNPSERKAE
jgi:Cu/Ag efflux protein CusF